MEWFPSDPVLNFLSGVRVWAQVWLSFIGDVQFDVSNDEWSLVLERTGTEAQHKYSEAHHGHHQRQQHRDLESGGSVEFSHGRGSKSEGPDGNHAGRRSLRSLLDRSCFFTRPPNQPASLTHPYLSRDSLCCRGSLPPHCACVPEASTFRGRSRFRCGRGAGRVLRGGFRVQARRLHVQAAPASLQQVLRPQVGNALSSWPSLFTFVCRKGKDSEDHRLPPTRMEQAPTEQNTSKCKSKHTHTQPVSQISQIKISPRGFRLRVASVVPAGQCDG